MQNVFAEAKPRHTPWMAPVLPVVTRFAECHPARTVFSRFIRTRIAKGTEVYADEAGAWNELHGRFTMRRINHQEAYSPGDGAYTNNAESFFSRMRRAEIGITTMWPDHT